MSTFTHALNWTEIEQRAPRRGLTSLVNQTVKPVIESAPTEALDKNNNVKGVGPASIMVMALFMSLFALASYLLPDVWWGTTLQFIVFPILFLLSIAVIAFAFKKQLVDSITRTIHRRAARHISLRHIAEHFGLEYSACPAGPNFAEAWLLRQSWLPRDIKDAAALEEPSIVLPAVEIAKDAGILLPMRVLMSTEEQRTAYRSSAINRADITDGFYGERAGVKFNMFEWSEEVNDNRVHHLTIVLNAPTRLLGYTELRARKIGWLPRERSKALKTVGVPSSQFKSDFKIRTSDQVEARTLFDPIVIENIMALGNGSAFRAVGFADHIVFDFPGNDRFALVDILTGQWSDASLRSGLTDILHALELVDNIGAMFRLKR